jgi:ligand-binding SRPBCC domain-containing protein
LEENERIIDIAIKSPFKYWKHEHIFRKTISGVELIDKLEIELPFGFLNKLAEPIFFFVIDNMFYTRQKLTKEYMENRKNEK